MAQKLFAHCVRLELVWLSLDLISLDIDSVVIGYAAMNEQRQEALNSGEALIIFSDKKVLQYILRAFTAKPLCFSQRKMRFAGIVYALAIGGDILFDRPAYQRFLDTVKRAKSERIGPFAPMPEFKAYVQDASGFPMTVVRVGVDSGDPMRYTADPFLLAFDKKI